jgi:hypothetical protein
MLGQLIFPTLQAFKTINGNPVKYMLIIISAIFLLLTGCASVNHESDHGEIRTDNTIQSGACLITVMGSIQGLQYDLRIVTEGDIILLDARVPKANNKPGIWKKFNANLADKNINVNINGIDHKITIKSDTVELVITAATITQYSKLVMWR